MEGIAHLVVLMTAAIAWLMFVAGIMWAAEKIPGALKSVYDRARRR